MLFGAKRLPELAKGLGQGIREFKGAIDGAKKDIEGSNENEKPESKENSSPENK